MCAPASLQRRRSKPFQYYTHDEKNQPRASSEAKWKLARRCFIMMLMWPLTLVLGLADTLQHTLLDEPLDYRARKQATLGGEKLQDVLSPSQKDRGLVILRRFVVAGQASTTMLVQVIFYFVALHLLQFFGLEALVYALKPDLEWVLGKLTGSLYRLHDGQEMALSIPGCLDPDFSLSYSPRSGFPQDYPDTSTMPPSRLTQAPHHDSSIPSGKHDASLTWQSSRDGLRTSRGSVTHHQSAQHAAQLGRLADGTCAASIGSSASLLASRDSNSSGGRTVPALELQVDCPLNAHFMATAAKLIYEDPEIVADCLEHRWGFKLHDMQHILGHAERECWLPDLVWCVCSNERAVVLMMKGADPVYQLDLRADPPCIKSPRPGVGEVHDGLWAGLHQRDPASPAGQLVVDRILRCLQHVSEEKQIWLCGHSLGGGLVTMLSLLLPTRWSDFSARVGGIFTFGAPRIGNAESAAIVTGLYQGRLLRYMHGSDMVCSLPPAWGYEHCGLERFLLSFPQLLQKDGAAPSRLLKQEDDPALLKTSKQREDRMAFPLAFCKLLKGLGEVPSVFSHLCATQKESFARLASRAALLPWPGFSDHFPYGYVEALREELELQRP